MLKLVLGGEGGFSAQFSGIIIFSMELYYGGPTLFQIYKKKFCQLPGNLKKIFG